MLRFHFSAGLHRDSHSVASPQTLTTKRNDASTREKGTVAIEFALLLPVLLLVVLGGFQFGLAISNYVQLTNAVSVGATQFAISRFDTTPATDAWSAVTNAAPSLKSANLKMTLSVNGTACVTNANSSSLAASGDSACQSALTAAAPSGGALQPAAVTLTYPCGTQLGGYDFWAATCQLSSTITEGVQ